jgi:hypothetical protein
MWYALLSFCPARWDCPDAAINVEFSAVGETQLAEAEIEQSEELQAAR